jgi:hypothetical protein
VRGLGALVYPVPLLLLAYEGWKARRARRPRQAEQAGEKAEAGEGRSGGGSGLVWLLGGLLLALSLYVILWYLPNHAELKRVNHYYLFDQLIPHSPRAFFLNWMTALFGDGRGLMPYLFRHDPVQTCLVLVWLVDRIHRARGGGGESSGVGDDRRRANADYLALWLVIVCALLCSIGYAPSRYYVLFLPAFSALAGLTLSDVSIFTRVLQSRTATLPIALFAFHVSQTALHHAGVPGVVGPGILAGLTAVVSWSMLPRSRIDAERPTIARLIPVAALGLWGAVNLFWSADWLLHLTYKQRDADRWLADNLPANSVLIGAVAPGLCLNNRFVTVNVIGKLCNDQEPVEKYAPAPRYVLILDDQWREPYWMVHYPDLIAPARRMHAFRGMLRPYFVIGLYPVPPGAERTR